MSEELPKLKKPPAPGQALVGYGRPPVETRFQPGRSGNPRGRPKGAKNRAPRLNEERMKSIVMQEAYRGIKVNDGARQITIPMAQAVMRAIAMKAVKGDHRSQRLFSELLTETERADKKLHDEWTNTALDYKRWWEEEIARCKRLGLPDPDPVPHPDHIDMDMRTGEIVVDGPMTHKQRDAGRQIVARLFDSQDELTWLRKAHRRARTDSERKFLTEQMAFEERMKARITGAIERTPWLQRELKEQTTKRTGAKR